jgi:hypothetical protein
MFKFIVSLLLFSSLSFAECSKAVTYLKENDIAKCSGYLFSPEKEQEVRIKIDQFEPMEKLIKNQDELINVLNQRVQLTHAQNLELEGFLQKRSDFNVYVNVAFFLAGAFLTGIIASNVNK